LLEKVKQSMTTISLQNFKFLTISPIPPERMKQVAPLFHAWFLATFFPDYGNRRMLELFELQRHWNFCEPEAGPEVLQIFLSLKLFLYFLIDAKTVIDFPFSFEEDSFFMQMLKNFFHCKRQQMYFFAEHFLKLCEAHELHLCPTLNI
jgi:hypothetical protein